MVLGHRSGHRHASASVASVDERASLAAPLSEENTRKLREGKREWPLPRAVSVFAVLAAGGVLIYSYIIFARWMMGGRSSLTGGLVLLDENATWSLRGRGVGVERVGPVGDGALQGEGEGVGLGSAALRQHGQAGFTFEGQAVGGASQPRSAVGAGVGGGSGHRQQRLQQQQRQQERQQERQQGQQRGADLAERGQGAVKEGGNDATGIIVPDRVRWPDIAKESSRKRLLLTSAGDTSNVKAWLSSDRTYDVVVLYYGRKEGYEHANMVDLVINRKGTKFPGAKAFAEQYRERFQSYESIALLDDDIIITPRGLEDLFNIRKKTGALEEREDLSRVSFFAHLLSHDHHHNRNPNHDHNHNHLRVYNHRALKDWRSHYVQEPVPAKAIRQAEASGLYRDEQPRVPHAIPVLLSHARVRPQAQGMGRRHLVLAHLLAAQGTVQDGNHRRRLV